MQYFIEITARTQPANRLQRYVSKTLVQDFNHHLTSHPEQVYRDIRIVVLTGNRTYANCKQLRISEQALYTQDQRPNSLFITVEGDATHYLCIRMIAVAGERLMPEAITPEVVTKPARGIMSMIHEAIEEGGSHA